MCLMVVAMAAVTSKNIIVACQCKLWWKGCALGDLVWFRRGRGVYGSGHVYIQCAFKKYILCKVTCIFKD